MNRLDIHDAVSVSIVIPVYNEAAHLPACLDAIARQTVQPNEVLVVDNNSTDDTVAIAAQYDFVKVIREPRQGVVYARDAGFDAATGVIIGRIDADTIISSNWVDTVQHIFATHNVDAVSGRALYHDMALAKILNFFDLYVRRYLALTHGSSVPMQGANMAIRRSAWWAIRGNVCRIGGMHEDFDLSVHAHDQGFRLRFDDTLTVSLGGRQTESSFLRYTEYILLSPKTYASHGMTIQLYMYPVCLLGILCYLPFKILHRGYDREAKRFSIASLFGPGQSRPNPATYVDY